MNHGAIADELGRHVDDEPTEVSPEPAGLLPIGALISGNFEIRALLGEGGMGQVYEAHDVALNRRVAMKVAWPHIRTPIRDEARALAALHDPCIATVFSVGHDRDLEYVVMELINGVTLAERLDRLTALGRRMDIDEAIGILARIADGLAAVHRAGIAHRDVKPANVMLAPGDRTVLMDFGIFQPVYDSSGGERLSGSPLYMAPELFTNNVGTGELFLVDVYAFGILAYELLTGEPPYKGNVMRVMSAHLNDPLPHITALRPETPPRIAALIGELLSKSPQDRPQTMEAVAWRLRHGERKTSMPPPFRLTVVIADDDEANALVAKELIEATAPEATVFIAANGRDAVQLLRRRKPHLLFLDLQMPRMNGIEVCMYLSGLPATDDPCRIVAMSSHAEPRDVDLLHQLGVDRYVPKGRELSEAIPEIVLETKRAHLR